MKERREPLSSYAAAGVDLDAADRHVETIRGLARSTYRPEVLGDIGGFGGLFHLAPLLAAVGGRYRDPVLVAGTDGVGTKLKVAFLAGRHDTVGQDCVAMCVNDVLAHGAEPLFFLDYIGVARLDPAVAAEAVRGVADGCRAAGCALLGGETAQMPGFYAEGEYDLVGTAVGVVDRDRVVDGSAIRPGDVLLGLASSGPHSNGFTLLRKVLFEQAGHAIGDRVPELGGEPLGEILLRPTRIYVRAVLDLLRSGAAVHGMAHITGGGLADNVPRILPEGCRAELETAAWPVPPIFRYAGRRGGISDGEMWRTFNMGIGFVLAVPAGEADAAAERLGAAGERVHRIGQVAAGPRGVDFR